MTSPSSPRWLLPIVAVSALVFGVAGYSFDWFGETPAEGWEAVTRAGEAGDWGAVWDRFDAESQNRLAPVVLGYARTLDGKSADAMTARERYKFVMQRRYQSREQFRPASVLNVQRAGDRASLTLTRPSEFGRVSHVYMTRHRGRWCVSYGATPP